MEETDAAPNTVMSSSLLPSSRIRVHVRLRPLNEYETKRRFRTIVKDITTVDDANETTTKLMIENPDSQTTGIYEFQCHNVSNDKN